MNNNNKKSKESFEKYFGSLSDNGRERVRSIIIFLSNHTRHEIQGIDKKTLGYKKRLKKYKGCRYTDLEKGLKNYPFFRGSKINMLIRYLRPLCDLKVIESIEIRPKKRQKTTGNDLCKPDRYYKYIQTNIPKGIISHSWKKYIQDRDKSFLNYFKPDDILSNPLSYLTFYGYNELNPKELGITQEYIRSENLEKKINDIFNEGKVTFSDMFNCLTNILYNKEKQQRISTIINGYDSFVKNKVESDEIKELLRKYKNTIIQIVNIDFYFATLNKLESEIKNPNEPSVTLAPNDYNKSYSTKLYEYYNKFVKIWPEVIEEWGIVSKTDLIRIEELYDKIVSFSKQNTNYQNDIFQLFDYLSYRKQNVMVIYKSNIPLHGRGSYNWLRDITTPEDIICHYETDQLFKNLNFFINHNGESRMIDYSEVIKLRKKSKNPKT